ncbi:amino acid permease [Xylariales sp. PMI_506]|nr:amino acid permease [Xylariales sp. PMI_506]
MVEETQDWSEVDELRQGLHSRHIQMIALAGTIGTGLFLGSGSAVANAGPLGALLGYSIVGALVCGIVFAIGEMGALVPLSGGIVRYCEVFVDPALAFANGWNAVYAGVLGIPAEIVAAATLIQFWVTVSNAIWITVFGLLMSASSLVFVRFYGELEFGFASLKILLIIIVDIMAIVIAAGGAPNHTATGFSYWRDPGPMVQYLGIPGPLGRFLGFWTTFSGAIYAYSGIEGITIAAAETRAPRTAIPRAAKRIFARVLLFYILSIFLIGLIVPSDNDRLLTASGTAASPFVIAATNAGIPGIASFINAIVITSAWSAGNSSMLGYSRILYGMAKNGHAPKIFTRLNRFSIPYVAVLLLTAFMALGYMTLQHTAATVFTWLQNLVSISSLVNWIVITITYLRFHYACKAQGIDRKELPWAAPLQPYIAWFTLFFLFLILLTSGYATFIHGHWSTETFIAAYINIPLILILYFGYKFYKKTKIVPLSEIKIKEYLEHARTHPDPIVPSRTGWRKLNILWG